MSKYLLTEGERNMLRGSHMHGYEKSGIMADTNKMHTDYTPCKPWWIARNRRAGTRGWQIGLQLIIQ